MLSILVGHSYFLRFDRKQWERAKPYPPEPLWSEH
jgi:anaerobic magnesium-protoporphyrin IX monomethyl ester cyclase